MKLRYFVSVFLLTAFLSSCLVSSTTLSKEIKEIGTLDSAAIDELVNQRVKGIINHIIANISILNGEMEDVENYLSGKMQLNKKMR